MLKLFPILEKAYTAGFDHYKNSKVKEITLIL